MTENMKISPRREGGTGDVPVLAGQVSSLTSLGLSIFARVVLAAICGVEMAHSGSAVSIGRDGHGMDMVHCGRLVLQLV
jgi:NAD(P)H-hydrate repair Nnr-like enzyme with NAD(P)H-hydrate dehydratase domain